MKEDLAEWLQMLYPHLQINIENFMERLETGVALCEVSGTIFQLKIKNSISREILSVDNFCNKIKVF